MKFSKLALVLAVLNAVLVGVVIRQALLLHRHRVDPALVHRIDRKATPVYPSRRSSSEGSSDAALLTTIPKAGAARPAPGLPRIRPVGTEPSRPPFDWQQVESEDYNTFIENLRAIGCPQQTVQDIVMADVMETFASERTGVMAEHLQGFQYWKADAETLAQRGELELRQREVDDWMGSVVQEYLGPDVVPPSTASAWKQAALAEHLKVLPAGKREDVMEVLLQYADVDAKIKELSSHPNVGGYSDERVRIVEAYDRKLDTLNALLTPEEYERLDMTVSWTADNLRRAMVKFEPTEEEYHAIFREWRAQDEGLAMINALGEPDPGRSDVYQGISEVLTPERYALYRRTWWK